MTILFIGKTKFVTKTLRDYNIPSNSAFNSG